MNNYKFLLSFFVLLLTTSNVLGQRFCEVALPICSDQSMTYPLGYDMDTINTNIDYSCLSDSLNPHWYTFVTTGYGDLSMQINSLMGGNFAAMIFGPSPAGMPGGPCGGYSSANACFDNTTSVSFTDANVPNGSIYHILILNNSDTTNQIYFSLTGTAFPIPSCPTAISNCTSSVASFSHVTNGQSLYSDTLCFLDTLSVDYTSVGSYPAEVPNLSSAMPYNPGTIFFVYWKYPDNFLPPFLDPGLANFIVDSDSDFDEINSQDLQNVLAQYPALQNKIYLKAFPAYNVDSAYVTHYCYDYSSPVIELTLLSPITTDTLSIDCFNNSIQVEFSGSFPELVSGQNFTTNNSNTTPPGLTVNPSSFANNSNVTIGYLPDTLAPVNFTITDNIGCKKEIMGYFGAPAPNFSYPDTVFCDNEGLILPNINVPIGDVSFYNPIGTGGVHPVNGGFHTDTLGVGSHQIVMETMYMTCTHDSTFSFNIQPAPEVMPVQDDSLCPGESIELTFVSSNGNALDFSWLNNNASTGIPLSGSGEDFNFYDLENSTLNSNISEMIYWANNGICTSDTLAFSIEVYPSFNAGNDTSVCMGETINLNAYGAIDYIWEDHQDLLQNNIPNPEFTVNDNSTLIVKAKTIEGCTLSDTVQISLLSLELCNEEINTAFSPNGDGINDEWRISGIENYLNNRVSIFNRWGDLIVSFENYDNIQVVWNGENSSGQMVSSGTYFYVVSTDSDNTLEGWVEVVK